MVSNKPKILLLGPPGAGKTVISNKISELLEIHIIKVGVLLREIPESDKNYHIIHDSMSKGVLAPNEIVAEIVKNEVNKFSDGYILDGWGRQMDDLNQFDPQIDLAIFLKVPKEECKERILNRVVCRIDSSIYSYSKEVCDLCGGDLEKREDDSLTTFENRWSVYESQTIPVINFYKSQRKLIEIDASKSIPEIMEEIKFKTNDYL